ncbi:MAG: 2,3-diketo-5-methylthiopentyl-phosphate enolase-phosphatase [Pseudomonadota bacterium]|jgi:enolase-phosphatase E1
MPRLVHPFILLDIEGTTTPISFVHKVLFPYARQHLARFLSDSQDQPEVAEALALARHDMAQHYPSGIRIQDLVERLQSWIDQDLKHPALKTIQGLMWEGGYRRGDYRGEVYDDVVPQLKSWVQRGHRLGIYSSGSIKAQHLLFEHTNHGDLRHFFSHYFDTGVGGKKFTDSYHAIAAELQLDPSQIWFLSDVAAELVAAAKAGVNTVQIVRSGTDPAPGYAHAADFFAADAFINTTNRRVT